MALGTESVNLVIGYRLPAIQHQQVAVVHVVTIDTVDIHTVIHGNTLMVPRLNGENMLRAEDLVTILAVPPEVIDDR